MIQVQIHDEELKRFLKKSPARAGWANREAFAMAGGHFKNKLRADIERGKVGGPKGLSPVKKKRRKKELSPLYNLGRWTRFKVGIYRGDVRLLIGFLNVKGKKIRFGDRLLTIPAFVELHEHGKRIEVTPDMRRRFFPASGHPLRKTTTHITIPARPMVEPFYNREKNNIPKYIKKRFFEKFFGKQMPKLGV